MASKVAKLKNLKNNRRMKVILVIYLILEALAAYYLYLQLGGEVARHLMLSGPAILLYIAACYKDPGYADEEKVKMVVEGKTQRSESIENALEQPETNAKRYTVQTRQCRVCLKPQLLRMKHCYECELCVATFDHHCIWIENCVGEKNRPLFFICVVSNLIAVLCGFCQLASVMWDRGEKKTHQLIFLSFAGVVLSALCLLFGLHGYLMCANVTTWQVTRWEKIWYLGGRSRAKSPFSQGLFKNVKEYWRCGWNKQFKLWHIEQQENVSETSTQ